MGALALVVNGTRLDELAQKIREEHKACCGSALTMLYHGIAAGEALLEAKEEIPRGEWQEWLAQNIDIAHSTVANYMRVARHKEKLLACEDVYTMQQALLHLRDNRFTTHGRTLSECREIQRYAKRHGAKAAALEFNVSYGTAWRYMRGVLPENREQRQLRYKTQGEERKRRNERKTARRALRKQGAAAAELYAMAEKMQDVLARAEADAQTREVKAALKRAGEHYRKMRDEVVSAVLAGGKQ